MRNRLTRLNSDGTLDSSFNIGTGPNSIVHSLAVQNDGRVLIGGFFSSVDTYTRDCIARLENTLKAASKVELNSSSNPAIVGTSLIFTATVGGAAPGPQPPATGLVTFTFDGVAIATSPISNGSATYLTNTLAVGTHTVLVTYGGDSNYSGSTSSVYTQMITPACNPQLVTSPTDDGLATNCGTLSYALATTTQGTISFALTGGSSITFTNSFSPTVKAGVILDGGVNGIVLNGNGVTGDGLRLSGGNQLTNLTIRGFSGRELVAVAGNSPNHLYRVRVEN